MKSVLWGMRLGESKDKVYPAEDDCFGLFDGDRSIFDDIVKPRATVALTFARPEHQSFQPHRQHVQPLSFSSALNRDAQWRRASA